MPADAFRRDRPLWRPGSSTGGSRTRIRRGLSSAALPVCVPCRKAPCTGLEPVSPARQAGRHTRFVTGLRSSEHPAGVEPARPPWESGRLPLHHRCVQSAQRESNPHVRHGKAAGSRYIMGANTPEHPVGVEPTRPSYQDGRLPLHHRCVGRPSSKGGRIRTHTEPLWRRPCSRYTTPLFSEARGT